MNAQNVTGETKKSENLKKEGQDSIFKAHLVNNEYQVWLDINFYDNNIIVPRQEFPVTSVQSVIPANGLFLMQLSKVRKRYLPSSMTMEAKT